MKSLIFSYSFFIPGEVWKRDRKELNYSFSPTFIRRFIDTFNSNAQSLLDDLQVTFKTPGETADLMPIFMKWALNVVLGQLTNTFKIPRQNML
jgi:cytochrome P450